MKSAPAQVVAEQSGALWALLMSFASEEKGYRWSAALEEAGAAHRVSMEAGAGRESMLILELLSVFE